MRSSSALLLLCLWCLKHGAAGASVAPPSAPALCATLGCSVHKAEGHSCQCNFHCKAHNDCCADVAIFCPNTTDPCATKGGCKSAQNTTKASAKVHNTTKTPTASSKALTDKAGSHHEHTSKVGGGSNSGSSTGSKAAPSKSTGPSARNNTGSDPKSSTGSKAAAVKSTGSSASSKESNVEHANKEDKSTHAEHNHTHPEHKSTDHTHAPTHHGTSLIVVLIGCAMGLFLPIAIATILILRSRGICCVYAKVERQEKPIDAAAGGEELPAPASMADGD